jgi:NADH-quinone oxidoreductase subunit J
MGHLVALSLGLGLPAFDPVQIVFAINTLAAVFSAINVLVQTNPIYSALFLVSNFFCLAVYYLLLDAQFLAAVQIIVYAGAIMVLFLFVVTLLSPGREETENDRLAALRIPSMALAVILGLGIAGTLFLNDIKGTQNTNVNAFPQGLGTVQTVGDQLFHYFLLPFEVTSLLLLVSMLGAIVLAKRRID